MAEPCVFPAFFETILISVPNNPFQWLPKKNPNRFKQEFSKLKDARNKLIYAPESFSFTPSTNEILALNDSKSVYLLNNHKRYLDGVFLDF